MITWLLLAASWFADADHTPTYIGPPLSGYPPVVYVGPPLYLAPPPPPPPPPPQ